MSAYNRQIIRKTHYKKSADLTDASSHVYKEVADSQSVRRSKLDNPPKTQFLFIHSSVPTFG